MSATSFPTPTPMSWHVFSGCVGKPCSIRWDGTTRTPDRTPRAELLRCPVRSHAALRPVVCRAGQASETRHSGVATELHRAVREADGGGRKGFRGPVEIPRPLG